MASAECIEQRCLHRAAFSPKTFDIAHFHYNLRCLTVGATCNAINIGRVALLASDNGSTGPMKADCPRGKG